MKTVNEKKTRLESGQLGTLQQWKPQFTDNKAWLCNRICNKFKLWNIYQPNINWVDLLVSSTSTIATTHCYSYSSMNDCK